MNDNRRKTVIIVGISSALGRAVGESLASEDGLHVIGTYRRWRPELEATADLFLNRSATLTLINVDVTNKESCGRFLSELESCQDDDVVLLYCCGKWNSGKVAELSNEEIESVISIGLRSPIEITAQLLANRRDKNGRTRIIIVMGLGGEKAGVRYNALYSAVTSGLYSFVRAVGMELAGTEDSCFGVALGLFDKGQPYIYDLCSHLITRTPTPLKEIVDFLRPHLSCDNHMINGAIVELSGGLFNYQDVCKLLTEGIPE